ncbi:MAG: hypothetical protein KAR47_09650 [Planctomycetes bacterium]|nr:hypothetical protein [Planctomycetota bacterium]
MNKIIKTLIVITAVHIIIVICIAVFKDKDQSGLVGPAGESGTPSVLISGVPMLCLNDACNAAFGMETEQFRSELARIRSNLSGGQPPTNLTFTCPKCSQQTAQTATRCVKCEKTFIPAYKTSDEFPDKCPGCGFSEIEYRKQLRQDQPQPPSGNERDKPTPRSSARPH